MVRKSTVMYELLRLLDHNVHKVLGYADDLVILVQGKYNNMVSERMQQTMNIIIRWNEEED